ncbi:hypothetical protein [Gimesia sp.]|uniref:hypothetical protein n=1 Tax=Gimesia sp. TaxID=2024833 RepID=UPI003A93E7E0
MFRAEGFLFPACLFLSVISGCSSGESYLEAPAIVPGDESHAQEVSNAETSQPSLDRSGDDSTASGMSFTHFLTGAPIEVVAAESRYDVIVATIEKVSRHKATNGKPPIVTLTVHEVLRGKKDQDRKWGYWAPFPHDVDWGGDETAAIIKKWEEMSMKLPHVGTKRILFGTMVNRDNQTVFWISPAGRFDYSDKSRELVLKGIKRSEDAAKKVEQESVTQAKAYTAKMKAWRAKYTADDIQRFANTSDFVGIGKVCSGPQSEDAGDYYDFSVTEILKGQRRQQFTVDVYYVTVLVPDATSELIIHRDRNFVLFLSDKNAKFGDARDYYVPISAGEGLVEADADALRAARAAVNAK